MQPQVLIVDDNASTRRWTELALATEQVEVRACSGAAEALASMASRTPDLMLVNYLMPGIDGVTLIGKLLRKHAGSCPMALVTSSSEKDLRMRALSAGAVDMLQRPLSRDRLRRFIRTFLVDKAEHSAHLSAQVPLAVVMERLAWINALRDPGTGLHMRRMAAYAAAIAGALGMSQCKVDAIRAAAPLHDIGKIGVPDNILLKPGRLDEQEWAVMRRHPQLGFDLLNGTGSSVLQLAAEVALHHHEHFDGSGYPNGVSGYAIPLAARVVSAADCFDALVSERPYKPAWTVHDALDHLDRHAGSQFDPDVVRAIHLALPRILDIKARFDGMAAVADAASSTSLLSGAPA
jgi:putative two-component system response regulator